MDVNSFSDFDPDTVSQWTSEDGRQEIIRCPSTWGSDDRFGLFSDADLIVTGSWQYVVNYFWLEFA
jgi:hypothetical protein